MTKEQRIIKLEAISYCLAGLIEAKAFGQKRLQLLRRSKDEIDDLIKRFYFGS